MITLTSLIIEANTYAQLLRNLNHSGCSDEIRKRKINIAAR